jgi:hypothetical protein
MKEKEAKAMCVKKYSNEQLLKIKAGIPADLLKK